MKIKKFILNGLWILILLFAFGGTPQKLLADNKGKLVDRDIIRVGYKIIPFSGRL